ncbi:hypothetical protein D9M72_569780 [compost metagenome]
MEVAGTRASRSLITLSSNPLADSSVTLAISRTTNFMRAGNGMPVRSASFITDGLPITEANARPRVKWLPHWPRT